MTIDIAVTFANECDYLRDLIKHLRVIKLTSSTPIDIYIQADSTKLNQCGRNAIATGTDIIKKVVEFPFEGDFAKFKNNLFEICEGDYIYQVDADEIPTTVQILYLTNMVIQDPNIDLIHIPRINIVNGITEEDIAKWGWRITDLHGKKIINFPDYQGRFYKNTHNVRWGGKVHERIQGSYLTEHLPAVPEMSMIHIKGIDRQRKQNEMYEKL